MKLFISIAILLLLGTVAKSQSIFKSLPPFKAQSRIHAMAIVGPFDTLPSLHTPKWTGIRLAGPDITFAIPDFSTYVGLGVDYVVAKADSTTGKWNYQFTIGPRVYGGANLGEPTVQTIGGIGARATFFNGWLALSFIYNLTTKKPQAGIGNPAALIPGLN
jgi:hypothetical protein